MTGAETGAVLGAAGVAAGAITPAGWLMAGSQVLSGVLAGNQKQPTSSSAFSETNVNSFQDNSGWTVATGQGKAEGATISKSGMGIGADVAGTVQQFAWPLVALVLLAGVYIWKRA